MKKDVNIASHCGEIKIIYEDNDLMVIDKPSGLITHAANSHQEKSLAEYLLAARPELRGVGEDESRPGIVHRLDKEASGLMVIAKNQESYQHLKKQFKNRKIEKEYLALAHGKINKEYGEINFPIGRSKNGHRMASLPLQKEGKKRSSNRDLGNVTARSKSREAITLFNVEKKWPHFTLIRLIIKTGRTHQIRVHLAAYGHPLLGDQLYATPKLKIKNQKTNLGRIFLLARRLAFKDRSGEKKEFSVQIPDKLQNFLDKLK